MKKLYLLGSCLLSFASLLFLITWMVEKVPLALMVGVTFNLVTAIYTVAFGGPASKFLRWFFLPKPEACLVQRFPGLVYAAALILLAAEYVWDGLGVWSDMLVGFVGIYGGLLIVILGLAPSLVLHLPQKLWRSGQ